MRFPASQKISLECGKMYCPCSSCDNEKIILVDTIWKHLYRRGFTPGYYIWFSHGENFETEHNNADDGNHEMEPENHNQLGDVGVDGDE